MIREACADPLPRDGCPCPSCSFFVQPSRAADSDESSAGLDGEPREMLPREVRAGLYWTVAITLLGLLFNGSLLLYHKVLMPVPAELDAGPRMRLPGGVHD